MYQEHFGLERPPFKITPDTSLFYEGSKRGAALEALIYAITSGEGIIKVVGEVGSGKTMLCRMLELRLSSTVDIVYIANPSLSPDNILHVIAHELQLDINSRHSKLEAMQKLQEYLLQKHANNRQVVLFVEEAQSMPVETLEEIRLLSNLETEQNKLLQMVLFGQPELDEKLSRAAIRQLKERITHSFYLEPFPPDDTREYLNFRLRSVGYRGPDVFNQKTASAVEKYSGGLTRRINILADKALMASYSEGGHSVTWKHVKTAALDSDFKSPRNWRPWIISVAAVFALLVVFYLGTLIPQMSTQSSPPGAVAGPERTKNPEETVPYSENSGQPEVNNAAGTPLLQQRLQKTREWLEAVNTGYFSLQLFLARHVDGVAVEAFLQYPPDGLELDKIYVYETVIDDRLKYSVLYNDYATRQSAQAELDNLPETLKANQPFLRRIETVVPYTSGA